MLVVLFLLLLPYGSYCNQIIYSEQENHELVICVANILEKYFQREDYLTFVDINSDGSKIITAVNLLSLWPIVSRKPSEKSYLPNQGYIVNAGNIEDFIDNFDYLKREAEWNPYAKFVIIIDNIKQKGLNKVFKELLDLNVYNVIVVNGTNQADIYTYNPFENFACGRHFDRIISYGQCATTKISNFFPNKLKTGLRNCTINLAVAHIPPLAFHIDKCELKHKDKCIGTEEYMFRLLSELEQFNVNYSYIDFAENFSSIDESDMSAFGSFSLIQKKQIDGLIGFTVLTDTRSQAFSYIYQYAAYADEFVFIVKKSGNKPIWQYIYIEFTSTVWVLLLTCFFISSALVIYLSHPRDKSAVVLKMFDSLFLHGFIVRRKCGVRMFLILWIWFAYLINSFYQSSLMSLTTHPSKAYQVSSEKDLVTHKFRSCVTPSLRGFLTSFAEMTFDRDTGECMSMVQAMKKVSETDGIYTIGASLPFTFNKHQFYDSAGELRLYRFPKPALKLIYATFFYKGFPLKDKLERRSLQVRGFGFLNKHTDNLYYEALLSNMRRFDNSFKGNLIVPWELLIIGYTLATIVFILEVLGPNRDIPKTHP